MTQRKSCVISYHPYSHAFILGGYIKHIVGCYFFCYSPMYHNVTYRRGKAFHVSFPCAIRSIVYTFRDAHSYGLSKRYIRSGYSPHRCFHPYAPL